MFRGLACQALGSDRCGRRRRAFEDHRRDIFIFGSERPVLLTLSSIMLALQQGAVTPTLRYPVCQHRVRGCPTRIYDFAWGPAAPSCCFVSAAGIKAAHRESEHWRSSIRFGDA